MPTTLLLDGPDLEALLVRARREGGPAAKITRAEKARRGGVMGFFSREVFEVAVEVPDGFVPEAPTTPGPLTSDGARPAAAGPVPTGPTQDADPFDAVVKAIAAMAGDAPATAAVTMNGVGANVAADLPALNAAGVSGGAARVRTAQRAATARAYSAGAQPEAAQAPQTAPVHSGGGYAATALLDRIEGATGERPASGHDTATTGHDTATTGHDTGLGQGHLDAQDDAALRHEPPADPVVPSTAQPAFTTLLDQLRREAQPPTVSPIVTATPVDLASEGDLFDPVEPQEAAPAPAGLPTQRSVESADQLDRPTEVHPERPADTDRRVAAKPAPRRPVDPRLKADRSALRRLGVPAKLTRRMREGDRFAAVQAVFAALPELDVDEDVPVLAVVGPARSALLEAHRVAVDLATDEGPRPILNLPDSASDHRETVLEASRRLDRSVVVIATPYGTPRADVRTKPTERTKADLRSLRAQTVVAVVDARRPLAETQGWLRDLGRVDAIAVEHAGEVEDPARVLELDLPVVRLDGVGMDGLGWTALLCARLAALDDA